MYFVTICVKDHATLLGTIAEKPPDIVGDAALGVPPPEPAAPVVKLTAYGEIVKHYMENISKANPEMFLDRYVIMPNHVHMILLIAAQGGTPT
jgi:hypothetical protein